MTASASQILALPPDAQAVIVTPGNPADYVVTPPSPFDGVARLIITMPGGTFGCSGSLLAGGQYILTAGHCISDGSAGANPTVSAFSATFNDGQVLAGASYWVAPGWTGSFVDGHDIALVRLAAPVVGIAGYDIWTGADPFGEAFDVAGYGLGGFGDTGYNPGAYPFGTLRAGQNELDPVVWGMPGDPYAWDFDNGLDANDTLCLVVGVCGIGLGDQEVMIAPGDSGGPSFYLGYLLGVHSFGATFGLGDIDGGVLNSSFGEVAGDTRVTAHAAWIDTVVNGTPEPGSMLLLGSGLAALLYRARRRRA